MAKALAIAFMKCPECDHEKAEIRRDKKQLLYRWCPECKAQYFTRTVANSERLEKKLFGSKPEEKPITVTEEKPKPTPQEKPKNSGFSLEF